MYCTCKSHYRRNADDSLRALERAYTTNPSYKNLQQWITAALRVKKIPVQLLVTATQQLETMAKTRVYDQMRQDPTFKVIQPRNNHSLYDSEIATVHVHYHDFGLSQYRPVEFNTRPGSSFHLSGCASCRLPSWEQPCVWCGYYPMGSLDRARVRNRDAEDLASLKQRFLSLLSRFPSFYHFYARSTLPPQRNDDELLY